MTLAEIGEFGLIETLVKHWGTRNHPSRSLGKKGSVREVQQIHPSVLLGMGDDAAAIYPVSGRALLLTTDTLVEGIHFNRSFSTFFQVGYKAVHVNVSDIAAMGGRPLYFLVSLGVSQKEAVMDIDQLYRGMKQASREVEINLVGGNTVRSEKGLFVSITLLGDILPKKMITRSGGSLGDSIYVTGTLGDAAAGLAILKKKWAGRPGRPGRPSDIRFLTKRHRIPEARWREGRLLAEKGIPSAMIDISDGLAADLYHLTRQSGTGAELDREAIPISPALARYAQAMNNDPLQYVLHGGDDYELLFAVPEKKKKRLDYLIAKGMIDARRIGRLVEKKKGLLIKDDQGICPLKETGYDHLRRREYAKEL